MLISTLVGFIIGFFMPIMASRFGKILPADPGLVCAKLWHRPRFPKGMTQERRKRFFIKWMKMLGVSFLWGFIVAGLFWNAYFWIGSENIWWTGCFLVIICFLIVIDHQFFLLPDFFTLPLLLLGLTNAYVNPLPINDLNFFNPTGTIFDHSDPVGISLVGVWFGYFLSVVSVFCMARFRKVEFGAGDVKMIVALGAWLGWCALNYTLLLSFVFFVGRWFVTHKKSGPFGPSLGFAAIIIFFILYAK